MTNNMAYTKVFISISIYALLLYGCAGSKIPSSQDLLNAPIKVMHNTDGHYIFEFSKADTWSIYSGKSPKSIDYSKPIATTSDSKFQLNDEVKKRRLYFAIKGKNTPYYLVSERRLPLKKQANFRDIGGFETKDGRRVAWGNIYRSGKLSDLKRSDKALLKDLNITTVCDFRSDVEQQKHPNDLPPDITYIRYPIGEKDGKSFQKLKKDVMKKRLKGEDAKQTFVRLMEIFADSVATDFKPVLDLLLQDNKAPLVYHCSGGKDRTGFMTAVILAALDVDMKTIRQDYLMSNYYRQKENQKKVRLARLIGLDQETLLYLFMVQDEYFNAVLNTIDANYGSMDEYLEQKFGLTPEVRRELKKRYTYDPKELGQ